MEERVSRRSVSSFPDAIIARTELRLLIRQRVRSFAIAAFRISQSSFDNSPSLAVTDIRRKCELVRQTLVVVSEFFGEFWRHLEDDPIELLDTVLQVELIVESVELSVFDEAAFLLVHIYFDRTLKYFLF